MIMEYKNKLLGFLSQNKERLIIFVSAILSIILFIKYTKGNNSDTSQLDSSGYALGSASTSTGTDTTTTDTSTDTNDEKPTSIEIKYSTDYSNILKQANDTTKGESSSSSGVSLFAGLFGGGTSKTSTSPATGSLYENEYNNNDLFSTDIVIENAHDDTLTPILAFMRDIGGTADSHFKQQQTIVGEQTTGIGLQNPNKLPDTSVNFNGGATNALPATSGSMGEKAKENTVITNYTNNADSVDYAMQRQNFKSWLKAYTPPNKLSKRIDPTDYNGKKVSVKPGFVAIGKRWYSVDNLTDTQIDSLLGIA